jgi:hypothetical protein
MYSVASYILLIIEEIKLVLDLEKTHHQRVMKQDSSSANDHA